MAPSTWTNGIPNNSVGNFYNAFIDNTPKQATTVTISPNGTITIDSVTIGAGDVLGISNHMFNVDNTVIMTNGRGIVCKSRR